MENKVSHTDQDGYFSLNSVASDVNKQRVPVIKFESNKY